MTSDRDDEEYSKFVPNKQQYKIVPIRAKTDKEHYQRKPIPTIASATPTDHADARKGICHQIIATCAVLLLSAACGLPIGYSAVLLPQLTATNTTEEIAIDIEMGSWIASVHSLATPVGSLMSGPLADFVGRRTTLLLSVIPTFLGWCVLATSQGYVELIVGRFLCGFATGILGGPAQVYIAETAEPNLRSLLIGAPFVSYSLGILVVYSLGSALHWRAVAWCGNILPAMAAIAIFCIPESPTWLLRHEKVAKAQQALTFLRGNEIIAQKEINEMTERLNAERNSSANKENILKMCCQREARKPLVIVIIFSILQMFSGTYIVVFYAVDIIAEFGAAFDTRTAAIWTAVVRIVCTLVLCVVLLVVRRRRILVVSGIGSGASCLVLSIYMYCHLNEPKGTQDILVAGICLLVYIAFNTVLMVMPGIMVGELFPARIRGRTAGGVFAAMNVGLFALAKAFPYIQNEVKMCGVFLIFGSASFLVALLMFMFQPETKGRSLDQIEDYFKENHWLWYKRDMSYKQVTNGGTPSKA